MKPAPFRYFAPDTLAEATALLHANPGARALAGGQSLIPAMNFRLARPHTLIDLGRIPGLREITPTDEGGLKIGAMAPRRRVETDHRVAARCPLLHEALPWTGHVQIRTRGTVGGSIAHADPSAEIPAVVLATGGVLHLQGRDAARSVPAEEFFVGPMQTVLEPDELLVAVELPAAPPGSGHAFEEVARRHGDYALVGVAARLTLADDGTVARARVALMSVGDTPLLSAPAAAVLESEVPERECIAEAAAATAAAVEPPSDVHASSRYRRHLVRVLVERALTRAVESARR